MIATLQAQATAVTAWVLLASGVHQLGLMQALYRVLELLINISTILGPTFIILGVALRFLSKSPSRVRWGSRLAVGGVLLLFIALGLLESIIGVAEWVSNV
jgi:hypothetical protein